MPQPGEALDRDVDSGCMHCELVPVSPAGLVAVGWDSSKWGFEEGRAVTQKSVGMAVAIRDSGRVCERAEAEWGSPG